MEFVAAGWCRLVCKEVVEVETISNYEKQEILLLVIQEVRFVVIRLGATGLKEIRVACLLDFER